MPKDKTSRVKETTFDDHPEDFVRVRHNKKPKTGDYHKTNNPNKVVVWCTPDRTPDELARCPFCKNQRYRCHESLYGRTCFDETKYFIFENTASSTSLDDVIDKYRSIYASNFRSHFHKTHKRYPENDELPFTTPPCMSTHSYQDIMNYWLTMMKFQVSKHVNEHIEMYEFAGDQDGYPNTEPLTRVNKTHNKKQTKTDTVEEEEV